MVNHGFQLSYFNDKEHVEMMNGYKGIMFYEDLNEIVKRIENQMIIGFEDVDLRNNNLHNCYFNLEGDFVSIGKRRYEENMPVFKITFVNSTIEGLEKLVKDFNLPFEKEIVKSD